jgi:hypothetical protein
MKAIRISNESYLNIKGYSVYLYSLEAFTCAYTVGFYRFRIFGYGMVMKDLTVFNKTLCDLRNKGYRLGHWYFRIIKL